MCLTLDAPAQEVIINEFLAANTAGLQDEDGDYSDWIELVNVGEETADLKGWRLTDDPVDPDPWGFPAISLGPGEFLVVFASDKDRRPTDGEPLHTDFKLKRSGEYLALFGPESAEDNTQSEFHPSYPAQSADVSYGRRIDEPTYDFFETPTPGAPNTGAGLTARVDPPRFGVPRGFYDDAFSLTLTHPAPDVEIRVTMDGREPTTDDALYTQPLPIDQTTIIRARAFKAGHVPSRTASHTYLMNLDDRFKGLPVISIQSDPEKNLYEPEGIMAIVGGHYDEEDLWVSDDPDDYNYPTRRGRAYERPTSVEVISAAGGEDLQIDCGIRVQGSDYTRPRYRRGEDWTQPFHKFSFRLYFRSEYGPGQLHVPLFGSTGIDTFDKIVLRGGQTDWLNPFIKDEFVRRLHIDCGHVASRGIFTHLFINGAYMGYYNPAERLDERFFQARYRSEKDWDVIAHTVKARDGDMEAWDALRFYIRDHNMAQREHYEYVAQRMDLVNFIDYLMVNDYAETFDWPNNNIIIARERSPQGKFRFHVWDAEFSFGFRYDHYVFYRENPDEHISMVYLGLRDNADFRLLFADRMQKHLFNGGALTDERVLRRYTELREIMEPHIADFDHATFEDWFRGQRSRLIGLYFWEGLLPELRAPRLIPHGGLIEASLSLGMENSDQGAAIYFRADGGDPRDPLTNQPADDAVAYAGPLQLERVTRVGARAFDGADWSALTEADYRTADAGEVLITEIMANPRGPDEGREWFELFNTSSRAINLDGWAIADNDGDFHRIDHGGPLIIGPHAHLVLGQSLDPAINGDVMVAHAYGQDVTLGNQDDELVLLQGDLVTFSVGYGEAFERAPRPIHHRAGIEPTSGASMGMAWDYREGAADRWLHQRPTFGPRSDRGTPGRRNSNVEGSGPSAIDGPAWLKIGRDGRYD